MTEPTTSNPRRRKAAFGLAALLVIAIATGYPGPAGARDLQSQLTQKRAQLQQDRSNQAALSTTLERYSNQINALSAQVAALRNKEAAVQQRLDQKQVELRKAKARLERLRNRLRVSLKTLRQRLVAIYKSSSPDVVAMILDAHGFDDLISRYEYLRSVDQQDNAIAIRVRDLRDQTLSTVQTIRAARNALAARRDALARTQAQLQARQSALAAAQTRKRNALAQMQSNGRQLQSDITDIQSRIAAAQRQAAQAAAAQAAQPAAAGSASAAGVFSPPSVSSIAPASIPQGQAISPFPASSPVTWGRTDQGVDGTTTPGSPLLAMGDGTVTIGHDPAGFGASYPIIHTSFGDFYYGHSVPEVADGAQVSVGQPIAMAHYGTWGNSTTPGGFEIGAWPPGSMTAGAAIRSWLISLPRV